METQLLTLVDDELAWGSGGSFLLPHPGRMFDLSHAPKL